MKWIQAWKSKHKSVEMLKRFLKLSLRFFLFLTFIIHFNIFQWESATSKSLHTIFCEFIFIRTLSLFIYLFIFFIISHIKISKWEQTIKKKDSHIQVAKSKDIKVRRAQAIRPGVGTVPVSIKDSDKKEPLTLPNSSSYLNPSSIIQTGILLL